MAHETEQHDAPHAVPPFITFGTLVALLILTGLTVMTAKADLGPLNFLHIWVALGIAAVKSSLVLLYFMHLRYDRPFNAVVLVTSLLMVALFLGFTLADAGEYQSSIVWQQSQKVKAFDQSAGH